MSGAVVMMMGGEGLSVVAVPSSVLETGADSTIVTSPVSAVVSGGVGPFNYLWSFTSPNEQIGISDINAQSTSFIGYLLFPGQVVSATAICTVTDSTGQFASTAGVVIQIIRDDV